MALTVVIDGGGTGSRLAAFDQFGHKLVTVHSGPANLSLGADAVWQAVKSGLSQLAVTLDQSEDWMPNTIWCGFAGSQQTEQKQHFLKKLPASIIPYIINDGHAQLLGCTHRPSPAACLAVGTGSVLNCIDLDSVHSIRGGWGFPAGDEGGGAWIGLRAVNSLAHWYDTRLKSAKLPPLIEGLLNVIEPTTSGIQKYTTCMDPKQLAQFAPLVFDTAHSDEIANDIVMAGAAHLRALVAETPQTMSLFIAGGLAKPYHPYLKLLLNRDIQIAPPDAAIQGLYRYANETRAASR